MEIEKIENVYEIIPLELLRVTQDVKFDVIPKTKVPQVDAVDRVLHAPGALSPGSVGEVKRPWYMHTFQADNLMVFSGKRFVELYTVEHGKIEEFIVTPDYIEHNGKLVYDGGAMLVWPRYVFHRILSDEEVGSASVNLATHYEGFDIRTNFNIYDLNPETGEHWVIREGHQDQPGMDK